MSRFKVDKGLKIRTLRCGIPVYKEALQDYDKVQGIDASLVYGYGHIEFALNQALTGIEAGVCVSENPFIETVVRASGQKQISKALDMFGLKGTREIAIFGTDIPANLIESIGGDEFKIILDRGRISRLKSAFSINDEEILAFSENKNEAIEKLINERIALVSTLI
jgi:tRNA threonylcarbamoyladenosine modification (KEOPS) complex Cgi121 subunit